jgi:uncharacterized membrane protein
MGLVGWIHTVLAVIALVAGAFNLLRAKGTPSHRWGGRVFAVTLVGLNISALTIYHFTGHFNTFHALTFASLSTLAVGLFPVIFKRPRRYWLDMHYFAIGTAYAGLVAAFANELLARVPLLQAIVGHGPLTPALIGRIFQVGGVLGQFITIIGIALLLWRYDAVMAKLGRRAIASVTGDGRAGLSDILLLFGAMALIGGCASQFARAATAPGVWQFLGTAGGIATLILAYRRRRAPGELRWLAAYYFLILFSIVWIDMLGHFGPRDVIAFRATVPMFGLVALGIFLSGDLVIVGLIATAAMLAAYQFAGDWFALAVAASGGGALLFAGWRLRPIAPPQAASLARQATP